MITTYTPTYSMQRNTASEALAHLKQNSTCFQRTESRTDKQIWISQGLDKKFIQIHDFHPIQPGNNPGTREHPIVRHTTKTNETTTDWPGQPRNKPGNPGTHFFEIWNKNHPTHSDQEHHIFAYQTKKISKSNNFTPKSNISFSDWLFFFCSDPYAWQIPSLLQMKRANTKGWPSKLNARDVF